MTHDPASASAACEWCGRAIAQNDDGRWYAVKGEERGYNPLTCEASDDARHYPSDPVASAAPKEWCRSHYELDDGSLPCQKPKGHDGPHSYTYEWDDEGEEIRD